MWEQSKEFSSHCPQGSRQQRRKRGWGNAVCAVTAILVARLAEQIFHRAVHSRRNAREVFFIRTPSCHHLPPVDWNIRHQQSKAWWIFSILCKWRKRNHRKNVKWVLMCYVYVATYVCTYGYRLMCECTHVRMWKMVGLCADVCKDAKYRFRNPRHCGLLAVIRSDTGSRDDAVTQRVETTL